jgi:hypothetical protein
MDRRFMSWVVSEPYIPEKSIICIVRSLGSVISRLCVPRHLNHSILSPSVFQRWSKQLDEVGHDG